MVEFSRDGCTSRDPYICYQSVRHFMKDAGMCTLKLSSLLFLCVYVSVCPGKISFLRLLIPAVYGVYCLYMTNARIACGFC